MDKRINGGVSLHSFYKNRDDDSSNGFEKSPGFPRTQASNIEAGYLKYKDIAFEHLDPEYVSSVNRKIEPYTVRSTKPQPDNPRLIMEHLYKIKLKNVPLRELVGMFVFHQSVVPDEKEVSINDAAVLKFLCPRFNEDPVKVTINGSWIDKSAINFVEALLPKVAILIDDQDVPQFKAYNADPKKGQDHDEFRGFNEILRREGFEPKFYERSNPSQTLTQIAEPLFCWMLVISSTVTNKLMKNETQKAFMTFMLKDLVRRQNLIIVNYRSPAQDFDINQQFGFIPPQWAPHSFYDAFKVEHIIKIVTEGFRKKLFRTLLGGPAA